MPVIDLNDYLGMPQQAPAQPVFRATTQNVDPMALRADNPYSSDAFLANVEARQRLAGLQRLAPVLQAQQAQLAYDKVAEDARLLRQKQEIEAQVQRATDEITQGAIDPESDQFNQQVMQFYGRNQLAFLDPRMKEAMSFLSNQNKQYEAARSARAQAEMKTQEDTRSRYLSALEGGELMPQEIPAGATQEQIAFLQGRAKKRKEETELERKQREAAEQDRKSAMSWAGKRGVPTDLINLMPDSASIYQLGSAYGGARGTSSAGGPVIKFYENKLQALKAQADALAAKAEETDDDAAREVLQKQALDASQRFIDTNAEFINKLDELNVTGGGAAAGAAPAFSLPNYPYSNEFRAGFEAAAGRFPAAVGGQFTAPGLTPAPAGGAAAGKSVVQQPQIPISSLDEQLFRIPVTEQPEFLKRKKAELSESSKVSEEWSRAKKDLESKLKEQFPDKAYEGTNVKPIEQLAMQIVRGEMIRDDDPNAPTDEFGQTALIPIHEAALRRVKLPRFDTAFTEPGKARKYLFGLLGTQDVTYNELIRDWAREFLSQRGLIQTPVQENATVPREEVDKAVNFLNKKVAMPQ